MDSRLKKLTDKARQLNPKKFRKLSAKTRHELLAALAWEASQSGGYNAFFARYEVLVSGAEMDRYRPASWLSENEACQEYFHFHNRFTISPLIPEFGTETGLTRKPSLTWAPKYQITVAMDQVRSPYNVGSILRLIDNFGFEGLVHNSSWLDLKHPQLKKAARGCEDWIPVNYVEDLDAYLTSSSLPIIGVEWCKGAIPISRWTPPAQCILLLGNEEYGIASGLVKRCSEIVGIPMHGFKHSMNLHHALAVVAHTLTSQLNDI